MSFNSQKFQRRVPKTDGKKKRSTQVIDCDPRTELTEHHVPPRCMGAEFVIQVPRYKHEAYHTLFGCSKSFEQCCEILLKDWWTGKE